MSLRLIDLNLVPVLQALLREKSVSQAARLLGLSQPAVSAALRRVRRIMDDELLVRIGGRMELTPRASALIAQVDAACEHLDTLFALPRFDPAVAARTFTIATPDQATFLFAPDWLDSIQKRAPGVHLRFEDLNDQIPARLAAREIDFAIMPSFFMEDLGAAPLHFRPLFRDHSVALFRTDHPLGDCPTLSEQHLAPWRMLSYHPGSNWIERKRAARLLGNRRLQVVAFVPQIALLPFLLLDRDDYAIVSQHMAERLVELLPLAWRPLGFETPPIDIGVAWSHLMDADPAHRWFREEVIGSAAFAKPLFSGLASTSDV